MTLTAPMLASVDIVPMTELQFCGEAVGIVSRGTQMRPSNAAPARHTHAPLVHVEKELHA